MTYQYPEEIIKTMKPHVVNLQYVIKNHFKNRHIYGSKPTKNWINELRRIKNNSGYDLALKQIKETK